MTTTTTAQQVAETTSVQAGVAAKAPVAAPGARGVAIMMSVGTIAVGVVAMRDALISAGAITGTSWITPVLRFVDGLTAQSWMQPAGVGLAVAGVVLLVVAVKPRRRTHRQFRSAEDTWIATRDVPVIARAAAAGVTGVAAATASGSTRRLTVSISSLAGFDDAELGDAVHSTVAQTLSPLARPPRLKIRIKKDES